MTSRIEGRLAIKGRYDALMFNVDKTEARLFEFKGLKKSDVTVPLSQTLIYAWLLYKSTGIIPSIEIIYLDEHEQTPIIFTAKTVREMIISALPELFTTVYNVISLRRAPEILTDKELCKSCRYKTKCEASAKNLFRRKRVGASLLSVLIFFMAAMMIMTQAFFFATNSSESLIEERELVGIRMKLANKVEEGKSWLAKYTSTHTLNENIEANEFYKGTMIHSKSDYENGEICLSINDLNYTLQTDGYDNEKMHEKVFAAMGDGYYLIRAYTKIPKVKTSLMYQVLVHKNGGTVTTKSYEEIWY